MSKHDETSIFYHFGCWGRIDDKKQSDSHVFNVLKDIKTQIKGKHPPNFITVAGDNYYPKKHKTSYTDLNGESIKIKILRKENVQHLIDSLSSDVPTYVLYGNHEMNDSTLRNNKLENNIDYTTVHYDRCDALSIQKKTATTPANSNIKMFKNVLSTALSNTLFIMVDTTLYDVVHNEDNTHTQCYEDMLTNNSNSNVSAGVEVNIENASMSRRQRLKNTQLKQVLKILNDDNLSRKRNIVFVGHHPIASIYGSNEKKKMKFVKNINLGSFFCDVDKKTEGILSSINTKVFYLCADTHAYEKSDIRVSYVNHTQLQNINTINIEQYIVGTGGAKLDDLPDYSTLKDMLLPAKSFESNVKYNNSVIEYFPSPYKKDRVTGTYGYLVGKEKKGLLSFIFRKVSYEKEKKDKKKGQNNVSTGGWFKRYTQKNKKNRIHRKTMRAKNKKG